MSRGNPAWDALETAMIATVPACNADDRFTDDDQDPAEVATICAACPLNALCDAYAKSARPKAGIWAGKRYSTSKDER
jgi:hypothetical protein